MKKIIAVLFIILLSVADIFLFRKGILPVEPSISIIPLLLFLVFINKQYFNYLNRVSRNSFLFFFLLIVLSIFFALFSEYDKIGTIVGLYILSLLIYLVTFVFFFKLSNKTISIVLIAALMLLGGSMLFDLVFNSNLILRGAGFAENPNSAALRINVITIALLYSLNSNKYKKLVLIFSFLLVFLTLSRSGLIIYLVTVFLSVVSNYNSYFSVNFIRKKIVKTIVTFLLAFVAFNFFIGSFIKLIPAFQSVSVESRISKVTGSKSVIDERDTGQGGRLYIVKNYLNFIVENPLGYGTGMSSNRNFFHASTHNMYLRLLVDFGILGLLLYLVFIFKGLGSGIKNRNIYYVMIFTVIILASFFTNTIIENRSFLIVLSIVDVLRVKENYCIKKI